MDYEKTETYVKDLSRVSEYFAKNPNKRFVKLFDELNLYFPDGQVFALEGLGFSDRLSAFRASTAHSTNTELLESFGYIVLNSNEVKNRLSEVRFLPGFEPSFIKAKLVSILNRLDEYYPDKIINGSIQKTHKNLGTDIGGIATWLGYASQADFLRAYKYNVSESIKSGRPAIDYDTVINRLIIKYADQEDKPSSIAKLQEDNPELASSIKTINNISRKLFGTTLTKYLVSKGVLSSRPPKNITYLEDETIEINEQQTSEHPKTEPSPTIITSKLEDDINVPTQTNGRIQNVIELPVLDRFPVGVPVLESRYFYDSFVLPTQIVGENGSFVLTMHGNSMIEAGINDGDYLVAQLTDDVKNGEIVIAILGDEYTVKTYDREPDRIRLQPENSSLQPIYTRDVQIVGKIIALLRDMDNNGASLKQANSDKAVTYKPKVEPIKLPIKQEGISLSEDGKIILGFKGRQAQIITVPTGVVKINDGVFSNLRELTSIDFGDSLKIIGERAFEGCSSLEVVELPDTIERIESKAFINTSINSTFLPASIEYCAPDAFDRWNGRQIVNIAIDKKSKSLRDDGKCWFARLEDGTENLLICYRKGIYKYEVPYNVSRIETRAFAGCSNLKELTLSEGLQSIGEEAFTGTRLKSFLLPASVVEVGQNFLSANWNFEIEISDDNKVFEAESGVLYEKSNEGLKLRVCTKTNLDTYTVKKGTVVICEGAFRNCSLNEKIDLPDSIVSIENNAFSGSDLSEIVFPSNLEELPDDALSSCNNLKRITLGRSLRSFPTHELRLLKKLSKITVDDQNTVFSDLNGILMTKDQTRILLVPLAYAEKNLTIPETVTEIGEVFSGCPKITSVIFPASISEVPNHAFADCRNLSKITFLGKINKICYAAFSNCGFIEIELSKELLEIGGYAFSRCRKLSKVGLPEGLVIIGDYAFSDCQIREIQIPESVKSIGLHAFYQGYINGGFEVILHGKNTEFIQKYITLEQSNADPDSKYRISFSYENIKNITKKDARIRSKYDFEKVKDSYQITGYRGSESVLKIPSEFSGTAITSIAKGALANGDFTEVNIPEGITELCENCLGYQPHLKKLVIPKSVINICEDIIDLGYSNIRNLCIYGESGTAASRFANLIGSKFYYNEQNMSEEDVWIQDSFSMKLMSDGTYCIDAINITLDHVDIPSEFRGKPITSVYLPDSKKIVSLNIPSTIERIYHDDLRGGSNIKNISIGEGNKYYWTDGLVIYNKEKTSAIKAVATSGLIDYIVPASVKTIERHAFAYCIDLTSIQLPENLEQIKDGAFIGCKALRTIYIPESTTVIEERAFYMCEGLKAVSGCHGVGDLSKSAFPITAILNGQETIIDDNGTLIRYKGDDATFEIPETVNSIAPEAFSGLLQTDTLQKVVIPDGVQTIGESAFRNQNALENVKLPAELDVISDRLFEGCKKLTSISLPSTVCSIGNSAFESADLKSISLPERLESIGNRAFAYCSMPNVVVPKSVKKVGCSSFAGIQKIYVYDTLDQEANSCEEYCDQLHGVPNSYLGLAGVYCDKSYHACAANARWCDHEIVVKSAITNDIKYAVWMGSDFEKSEYYCVLASSWGKNAEFNFNAQDNMFGEMKAFKNKSRVAVLRLRYKWNLSNDIENMYRSYLSKNAKRLGKQFIDEQDMEGLVDLETLGFVTGNNINYLIDYANEKGESETLGHLLNFKHENIESKTSRKFVI